jgi:hypothetical protein
LKLQPVLVRTFRCILTTILFSALACEAYATHIRAVEIQVKQIDCSSSTVEVTIKAFTNYFQTNVLLGGEGSLLSFGDGATFQVPETDYEVFDPDLHIGLSTFKITHTYNSPGYYTVSYAEENRNLGIINMGSGVIAFYTETAFLLQEGACNHSPVLLAPAVDRACTGVAFYHNPGAVDADGDSLSYELVTPRKATGANVDG